MSQEMSEELISLTLDWELKMRMIPTGSILTPRLSRSSRLDECDSSCMEMAELRLSLGNCFQLDYPE